MKLCVSQRCLFAGFNIRPALKLASSAAEGAQEFVGWMQYASEVVIDQGCDALGGSIIEQVVRS